MTKKLTIALAFVLTLGQMSYAKKKKRKKRNMNLLLRKS